MVVRSYDEHFHEVEFLESPDYESEDEFKFTFWSNSPYSDAPAASPSPHVLKTMISAAVMNISSRFKSYRHHRKYEVRLHCYLLGRAAILNPEPCRRDPCSVFRAEANESQESLQLTKPSESAKKRKPTIIKKHVDFRTVDPDSFIKEPSSKFITLAANMLNKKNKSLPIAEADIKLLISASWRYACVIANNATILMNVTFTICKTFSAKLRHLQGLVVRVISLLEEEQDMTEDGTLDEFYTQTRRAYTECDVLSMGLIDFKIEVQDKINRWKEYFSMTADQAEEIGVADGALDEVFEYYESISDEFNFGESIFCCPEVALYKTATQFLRSVQPKAMMTELEANMTQVLTDIAELESGVATMMNRLEGKLY